MNFLVELADLIDAFADANETFKKAHKADYNSKECFDAYDRKKAARFALDDALVDALEAFPRDLSNILRSVEIGMIHPQPELLCKVAKAIGDISTRNSGVIGHAVPLRSKMSVQMIEEIARTAIKTMLD